MKLRGALLAVICIVWFGISGCSKVDSEGKVAGGSPKELAAQAKAQGYTLISDPSPTSRFSIKGDDVTDWNGVVIGKYSEGAMTK